MLALERYQSGLLTHSDPWGGDGERRVWPAGPERALILNRLGDELQVAVRDAQREVAFAIDLLASAGVDKLLADGDEAFDAVCGESEAAVAAARAAAASGDFPAVQVSLGRAIRAAGKAHRLDRAPALAALELMTSAVSAVVEVVRVRWAPLGVITRAHLAAVDAALELVKTAGELTRPAPTKLAVADDRAETDPFLTINDAAKLVQVTEDALRGRLRRYRSKNPGSDDLLEVEPPLGGGRGRRPSIMVRTSLVRKLWKAGATTANPTAERQ